MPGMITELPFIDLYVRLDQPDQAYYRSSERTLNNVSQFVPADYQESLDRFIAAVKDRLRETHDGSIEAEGVRCRLSRQKMSDNSHWACARRINTTIPDIEKLGLPAHVVSHMQTLGRRDGLIVIAGATGAGKTTTAVALLGYFLKTYGGTAITIEDPCEYMLAGRHGSGGQCYQIEVEKEEDWAMNLKRSLRWAPRYIYVGEIRTPKAAEQMLRAAATGHLVITTVHAGAIEEAMLGIVFLAEQAMGSGVHNMLAASLTALAYQSIKDTGVFIKYLSTEEGSSGDPVRSLIREGKIGMLSTYVDRTNSRLQGAGPAQFTGGHGTKKV